MHKKFLNMHNKMLDIAITKWKLWELIWSSSSSTLNTLTEIILLTIFMWLLSVWSCIFCLIKFKHKCYGYYLRRKPTKSDGGVCLNNCLLTCDACMKRSSKNICFYFKLYLEYLQQVTVMFPLNLPKPGKKFVLKFRYLSVC